MRSRLPDALSRWVENQGFAFDAGGNEGKPDHYSSLQWMNKNRPGLQGTEMWLSIVFLMADVLGISASLSY